MPDKKKKPSPRVKAPARKTAVKKTATRTRTPARAKRTKTQRAPVASDADAHEQPAGTRPVAVGSARALWETDDVAAPALEAEAIRPSPAAAKEAPPVVDKPLAELGVAVFSALLAASVFLPWYHNGLGTVSGWASGTWGPIVFFLAMAALAIVVLRRARIAIAFPVEPTLVIEGIGWVCVIALILKRYFPPKAFAIKLPTDGWIFVSLGFALGLALLAGVASSDAPFVLRPGWYKGTAGKIGTAVIVLALAGGLTIGFTNTAVSTSLPRVTANPPATQYKGLPPCANRLHLPTPIGFTPTFGSEINALDNCNVLYSTAIGLDRGFKRFVATLQAAGWTVSGIRTSAISRTAQLSGNGCGVVTVAEQPKKPTAAEVILYRCVSPTPTK